MTRPHLTNIRKAAVLVGFLLINSAWPASATDIVSLEDRMQQLTEDCAAKDAQLETLTENYGKLEKMLEELQLQVEQQQASIAALQRPNADAPAGVMPKSCADLKDMGHTANGLYLVMGSDQVEAVFCDFTAQLQSSDQNFETRMGQIEVKSAPVYFYVHKNINRFNSTKVPIPFEVERLNIGGAMNVNSGIFTAPQSGIYFFSFSGIATDGNFDVGLYVNNGLIGTGHSHLVHDTFTVQSALNLRAGDKVSVQLRSRTGGLFGSVAHTTHFTGWLLRQDLSFEKL